MAVSNVPDLVEVRCRGCRRFLGLATNPYRVVCDEFCAEDYEATVFEERESLIWCLYKSPISPTIRELTEVFPLSRQRVEQIIRNRDLKYQANKA